MMPSKTPIRENDAPDSIRPEEHTAPARTKNNATTLSGVMRSLNSGAEISTTKNGAVYKRTTAADKLMYVCAVV